MTIIRKPLKLVAPDPLVEDDDGGWDAKADAAVDGIIIELARQAAWTDHLASLQLHKAKK